MISYLGSLERDPDTGQEYLILETNSTDYRSNQEICERHGGCLPEPRSYQENEALRQFIASHDTIRLGIIKPYPDATWTYASNRTDVIWNKWDQDQPIDTTKKCSVSDHNGVWTPVTCDNSTSVNGLLICQGKGFSFSVYSVYLNVYQSPQF